jgi:urea transport system substrate-binding protein
MRTAKALVVLAILGVAAFIAWRQYFVPAPPIKIGVLHSLTGTMATSEKPLVDGVRLAVEEINAQGGLLGRQLEMIVADSRSDPDVAAAEAERLITKEGVKALFGCWTSSCRKAVKPVVEKHHHLLFYPMEYEGLEMSPNIIYTGAAPNQQIIPGTHWALENLGKRIYLVGSDNVFARMANVFIKDMLTAQGGVLAGERYLPLGDGATDAVVADIIRQRPDTVLNTINGESNAHFFAALEKAGLTNLPIMSFSIAEVGMKAYGGSRLSQHYVAHSYFQSLPGEENHRFVAAFQARYGADRVTCERVEDSYIGLLLWAQAAREAGSAEPAQVQSTILLQTLLAPEGMVAINPETHHLWKTPRIGKVRSDGQFDIIWDAGREIEPVPFPTYRLRDEWLQLLKTIGGAQS